MEINRAILRVTVKEEQTAKRPSPISCCIKDGAANVVFDRKELRSYLNTTVDAILWVEDADGNRAPIRVEFLREILS